jgi:hypothetical protein
MVYKAYSIPAASTTAHTCNRADSLERPVRARAGGDPDHDEGHGQGKEE